MQQAVCNWIALVATAYDMWSFSVDGYLSIRLQNCNTLHFVVIHLPQNFHTDPNHNSKYLTPWAHSIIVRPSICHLYKSWVLLSAWAALMKILLSVPGALVGGAATPIGHWRSGSETDTPTTSFGIGLFEHRLLRRYFLLQLLIVSAYRPIHCNYQFVHYSVFCRISPSILNRFKPNLQA